MPVLQGFGRGDHRVLVNVLVPRRLSDEQRSLLEQFEQLSDQDTYRGDDGDGFFDKLKSAFR
jgi:molecular chaperone DnaJ